MPFNGSDGTYTLSDTIAPSTLADANELQAILDDIATALSNVVCQDGQTPITAQLKGLVSANPVYSFDGDANTGYGSDTADEVFVKCGGTKIFDVSSAGLDILSGDLLKAGAAFPFPAATVMIFRQTDAPTGWTKQAVLNDMALRLTTGAVSFSQNGTAISALSATQATATFQLLIGHLPSADLAITDFSPTSGTHVFNAEVITEGGGATRTVWANSGSALTFAAVSSITATLGGSNTAHSHTYDARLHYADVISASKN